jgi:ribosomal protein L12E/L44/L45/RPP1/RPP2
MTKTMFAVLVAAGLMAAPLPQFVSTAAAQAAQPAPEKKESRQREESAERRHAGYA